MVIANLRPHFKDNYGHPMAYVYPDTSNQPKVYIGVVWSHLGGKVFVDHSKPYTTVGPAKAWVTRYKKQMKRHQILDSNILTQYAWTFLDDDKT